MNTLLDLLADVNQILTHPATQADRLQRMQYERQQQQLVAQLTNLMVVEKTTRKLPDTGQQITLPLHLSSSCATTKSNVTSNGFTNSTYTIVDRAT